jgi:tetratricopeptide (TPR) repeat protein
MKAVTAFALVPLVVAVGWIGYASTLRAEASTTVFRPEPAFHEKYDPAKIDRDIAFHEGRVKRDPKGAIGWAMLSDAYLARSRESDSDVFGWKAEAAARKSLALRSHLNVDGTNRLIQSLLEQHRFRDALAATEEALRGTPGEPGALRLQADSLVELGRYDEALAVLKELPNTTEDVAASAIQARIQSLRGDHQGALQMFKKAYTALESSSGVPEATLGWFKTKIAGEYEAQGDLESAKATYAEAMALAPRTYKATLGLARIAMQEKDWPGAATWAEKTLPIANSLDAIAILGEAAAAQGREKEAKTAYAKAHRMYVDEVANMDSLGKGGSYRVRPIDRQFATLSAKHGLFLKDGLQAAIRDAANRPDGRALDNLGWIQWQLGDKQAARENLRKAKASGLADPLIAEHASQAGASE